VARASGGLLRNMGQFVREKVATRVRVGLVSPGIEDDMVPHRVGLGAHCARRCAGGTVRVDAHAAEVIDESRFHPGT
jgi:hypothetical protein